jgi:hypothetical protein
MLVVHFFIIIFISYLISNLNWYFFEGSFKNSYNVIFQVEELKPIGGGIHTSIGNNDGSLVRGFWK